LEDKTRNLCANLILVWSFPAKPLLFTQKVRVKVTLEQAMKAQGGSEVALLFLFSFFDFGARLGRAISATPRAALPPGKRPSTHV